MSVWKKLLKSKTMLFSLALTTFSIAELNLHLFMDLIGPTWYPAILTVVSLIYGWLRVLTTTPLEDK